MFPVALRLTIAKNGLDLPDLLASTLKSFDYRHVSPCLVIKLILDIFILEIGSPY